MSTILVTGGAGYIGSHTTLELLRAGHDIVIVDDLSNGSREAVRRVEELAGRSVLFVEASLLDRPALDGIFREHAIDAVIHFAAKKAVGESVAKPLLYYRNNVVGTLVLLEAMREAGVHRLVFSSSATVYGDPETVPIREDFPLSAVNPYGRTKLIMEDVFRDVARSSDDWTFVLLRYFNPVGAHESGRIGEDPHGIPNNLMPYLMQVAVGRRERLSVFGGDYPTPDGTGVRDYIHVVDLAQGHVAALEHIDRFEGARAVNLGTGHGYSVLDVVRAASKAVGRDLPYAIVDRRPGDVATCYADPTLAHELLEWRAERDLDDMCRDHWNWQHANPDGYGGSA